MRLPILSPPVSYSRKEVPSLFRFRAPGTAAFQVSQSLAHLTRLAANLVKADGSFLLLNCDGQLTAAQSFGVTGLPDTLLWDDASSVGLSTVDGIRNSTFVSTAASGGTLATVAIQHDGIFLGILGMYNPHPRVFIAAQEYVVQAIAFEIADHLVVIQRGSEGAVAKTGEASSGSTVDLMARLRLLESVVVHANDSILITEAEPIGDPGPRIVYANPAFTRTTGYSLADVLGKSPRILQGPLTAPEGPALIHAALKAWEPVQVELLNYRKDGTTFWVELSISPVCDETGWWTHWVSVQRDMTERRALDSFSAIALPRARILLAVEDEAMRSHILEILGQEYKVEAVNGVAEALRVSVSSLPDLLLVDLSSAKVDDFELVRAFRVDARTYALPIILIAAGPEGVTREEDTNSVANDYLTKPFSSREIKARVRLQLDLQTLRRDVAAKEAFIRMTEALRQSEKLAVVGRLASSIAHEINNPLEAVTNLLYLAESGLGETEAAGYVRQAQAEVERVANIASQTLRFHRQASGPQKTSLPEVLDGVLALFKGRPRAAGLSVERQYRTQRAVLALEADVRQVFANLIGNAIDASAPGSKIVLRVKDAVDPRTMEEGVLVLVGDNGHGMSEETQRRLFDPFFTTKGMAGTGLGLWVSAEILRNHRATVRVRSCQGADRHGTVFSIFFPVT